MPCRRGRGLLSKKERKTGTWAVAGARANVTYGIRRPGIMPVRKHIYPLPTHVLRPMRPNRPSTSLLEHDVPRASKRVMASALTWSSAYQHASQRGRHDTVFSPPSPGHPRINIHVYIYTCCTPCILMIAYIEKEANSSPTRIPVSNLVEANYLFPLSYIAHCTVYIYCIYTNSQIGWYIHVWSNLIT